MALVNSTVQRQVIGLKDMYGSNNNDLYLYTIKIKRGSSLDKNKNVKLACGVECKLTAKRKEMSVTPKLLICPLQFITAEPIHENIKIPIVASFAVLYTLNMSCCTVRHGTSPPS